MVGEKRYIIENEELVNRAKSLVFSRRKVYTVLKGNPFGFKEGIHFTGTGIEAAIRKSVVNFTTMYGKDSEGNINEKLMDRIRTIIKAELADSIVPGMNGDSDRLALKETERDVEASNSGLFFDEYFYEKETDRIYTYHTPSNFNMKEKKELAKDMWSAINKYGLVALVNGKFKNGRVKYKVTRWSGDNGVAQDETISEFILKWKNTAIETVLNAWKKDDPYSMSSFCGLNVGEKLREEIKNHDNIDVTKPYNQEMRQSC